MLRMNQIDQVKELQRQGLGPQEIASRPVALRPVRALLMRATGSFTPRQRVG
jgi:hypothetical protein